MKNKEGAPKGNSNGFGNKGKPLSEEHKRKISESLTGKVPSQETRAKLSLYWKGKKRPEYSGQKHWNWKGGKSHNKADKSSVTRVKTETCELCKGNGRIVLDHDHSTGKFRGWLCNSCNIVLGLVKEDIGRLKRMIEYIEEGGIK